MTFVIEATQDRMQTPEDGALRVTVEGGEWEARQMLIAVLRCTRDINRSFLATPKQASQIEAEFHQALAMIAMHPELATDQTFKIGTWDHVMREQVAAD